MFQHAAARRRLANPPCRHQSTKMFQHAAARRRLAKHRARKPSCKSTFQHAAARRRLAAVKIAFLSFFSFNTQPPEGGWLLAVAVRRFVNIVSTRSRPKAAGSVSAKSSATDWQFQHAAARRRLAFPLAARALARCFNTQPPEGGWVSDQTLYTSNLVTCFNTQPPEGGWAIAIV